MTEDDLRLAHSLVHDEPDEAMRVLNDILNEHFDDELAQKALFMSGYIMMEAERYGLAYNLYKRCAELNPRISEIYSNMGMCLEEEKPEEAIKLFRKAQQIKPDNSHAMANEGLMHLLTGKPKKCIDLSEKALKLDPELRSARHNRGLARLMLRDFDKGWEDYYDTLGVKHREGRDYGLPEWEGQPGKVVVYGEQGVGDEIMFASCLEDIMKTNEVVLDCDSRLEGLFKRSFDIPVYGTRYKTETPIMDADIPDYQIAIGQLPYFYRRKVEDFPGTPYLKPDPERCVQWRALFDTLPGRKIGIAWRGGTKRTLGDRRSLELDDFKPLFEACPDDTLISLEYKPVDDSELGRYGIKSYPETAAGGSIDALAALVNELDFVICPCTSIVYVAGALGVQCDVLVPDKPGYRYHMEGGFPWYSSVSLIRQQGTWGKTVDKYCDWLRPSGDSGVSRAVPLNSVKIKPAGEVHAA